MENKITKKAAIKIARSQVSMPYKFGDGYKYNAFCEKREVFIESIIHSSWHGVMNSRHQALLNKASILLGNYYKQLELGTHWTKQV